MFVNKNRREILQYVANCLFLVAIVIGLVIVILLHLQVFPDVQDTRCKCVCPHDLLNVTNRTIFVKLVDVKRECDCREVIPDFNELLCSKCKCRFEMRNNLLVKVIIISMMLFVLFLFIYTVIYMIYKAVMYFRPPRMKGYQQTTQQSLTMSINDANIVNNQQIARTSSTRFNN